MLLEKLSSYENVHKIACFVREQVDIKPNIGIICGSGLGKIADSIKNKTVIPYKDIPGFPQSTVAGHKGNLIFGQMGDEHVVAMQGRFHLYEDYSKHQIAIPIRVLKMLGVEILLISNAAGGLNRNLHCGDFVIIKDHISFPHLSLQNVLIGSNDERFGPRFVPTSDAYNFNLRKLALQIANEENIRDVVHEGVYAYTGGPSYESPAECKMMLKMGCDVVGMSSVPEVILARHCGIKVLTVSLVTNMSVLEVDNPIVANHEEVLNLANEKADLMLFFFEKIISRLHTIK